MMTSDKAMKTLGLQQTVAGAGGRGSKTLRDYSEEDITQAFQSESQKLGKLKLNKDKLIMLTKDFSTDLFIFSNSRKIFRNANLPRSLPGLVKSYQG